MKTYQVLLGNRSLILSQAVTQRRLKLAGVTIDESMGLGTPPNKFPRSAKLFADSQEALFHKQ